MSMKNIFKLCMVSMAFSTMPCMAQQITVAPAHMISDYEIPEKLDNQMKSKLQRSLTAYGIASEIGMSSFAMVPEVVINDEHTTTTVPVYCNIDFDLVITLKDIYTGKIFASFTQQGKGKGTNKSNAIAKGVSSIRLNTPEFQSFCESAKDKVVIYYEQQMPALIASSKAAANGRNFEQAIGILSEIPEECKGYDTRVAPLIGSYYKTQINLEGESILAEAKAAWAQSPNEAGAEKVASILSKMPASCTSSSGAAALIQEVKKRVTSLEAREFAFEERQANRAYLLAKQSQANTHSEKMASISAARAIGVAWAKNQPKRITKVYLW